MTKLDWRNHRKNRAFWVNSAEVAEGGGGSVGLGQLGVVRLQHIVQVEGVRERAIILWGSSYPGNSILLLNNREQTLLFHLLANVVRVLYIKEIQIM
jgi:hypothetical protein